MIRNLAIVLSAAALALAADNPWDKVKELKSGTEIRIVRKGVAQPIEAKFDELTDENVLIVVKNEQKAVPRNEVDRLDARPSGGSRVTTETKTTVERPGATPPISKPTEKPNIPGKTYSSGINIGSKPAYETIYRRTAAPASQKK
jgi:hypothetical protein